MTMNKTYKDFLGNEVSVGDIVITTELQYRNFMRCKVVRITDKMVFLKPLKGQCVDQHNKTREFKQFHDQTIKI